MEQDVRSDFFKFLMERRLVMRSCRLVLWIIVLALLLELVAVEARVINRRSPISKGSNRQLCSKKLSEAMYLVCKERGYNSPFGDDGQGAVQQIGPGLVQECCYNTCSLQQMEQYCKPDKVSEG